MKRIFAVAIASLLAIPSLSFAANTDAQTTIKGQLEAFIARKDAEAYSFAAPNVRAMFPNQEIFMMMVRKGYPQVYSPKNYSFGKSADLPNGQIAQEVLLTGPDDRNWAVLYTVEKQEDGTMRITGVQVRPSDSLAL